MTMTCTGTVKLWLLRLVRSASQQSSSLLRQTEARLHFRLSTAPRHRTSRVLLRNSHFTAHGSDGSIVFSIVANFLSQRDNSWTAALSLMKFCTNMYLGNLWNPIEFQCHRSKVKVTWVFVCVSCLHDTAWTSWAGFKKCYSLDGASS